MKSLIYTSLFIWLMLPAAGCVKQQSSIMHAECSAHGRVVYNKDVRDFGHWDDQMTIFYGIDGSKTRVINATCIIK